MTTCTQRPRQRKRCRSPCIIAVRLSLIGNGSAPIQLEQCRFPGLAISNSKILIYFFKQNIRKQFYQTALGNCYGLKLPKCWWQFKKKCYCVIYYNFRLSFLIVSLMSVSTRSSATAERIARARCQPTSWQLLHNCRNKFYNKSTTDRSNGVTAL